MKIKTLLLGAASLGLGLSAQAQTTTVDIVGATAFRAAAHTAIMNSFTSVTGYAHSGTAGNAGKASRATYKGTFPGITGTTVIRVSWTGSVEGVRSLVSSKALADTFIPDSTVTTGEAAGVTATVSASKTAVLAFSDVAQVNTPYKTPALKGGPVGVIVFAPVINKGAESEITNVTSQQLRQILKNGNIPESMLTGNTTSNGTIYLTGRNDGSGTRVAFLMETGHGAANAVKQYVINSQTSTASLDTPVLAPTTANATVYGANYVLSTDFTTKAVAGNGGYNSGGAIAAWMKLPSAGDYNIVSWLGTSDAITAYSSGSGGRVLSYNGEKLDGVSAGTWTDADRNKIRLGKYSAWTFENLFYKSTLSATSAGKKVYDALVAAIPANIGTAGVANDSSFKVTRTTDGGVIAPK